MFYFPSPTQRKKQATLQQENQAGTQTKSNILNQTRKQKQTPEPKQTNPAALQWNAPILTQLGIDNRIFELSHNSCINPSKCVEKSALQSSPDYYFDASKCYTQLQPKQIYKQCFAACLHSFTHYLIPIKTNSANTTFKQNKHLI
jgi:hypothetical protein